MQLLPIEFFNGGTVTKKEKGREKMSELNMLSLRQQVISTWWSHILKNKWS